MVSNARDDLPDPLGPVTTTRRPRGIRTSRFFRLCSRAPFTCMCVAASMFANFKRIQKRPGANAIARDARRLALACACALGAGAARADVAPWPFALRNGESITYNVRWGIIPFVGRIKISAEEIGTGADALLRVTTTTSTGGVARGLFPFDGKGESVYQERSGRLVSSSEWSAYRNKEVKNSIVFNYGKSTASFTDD